MTEPILRADDLRVWEAWRRQALTHARTQLHQRRVHRAEVIVGEALGISSSWCVMCSGGKDSTALVVLICGSLGHALPVASEKDDLDYPGEEDFVRALCARAGAPCYILRPPISAYEYVRDHCRDMLGDEDMHSRAAGLSKTCFYDVVEGFARDYEGIFLGLRAEESKGRNMNRATHGVLYKKQNGQRVCTPLADWRGIDVYAYLFSRGYDLLDVYRCVAFLHADDPSRVRKSWWITTSEARHGATAWLRRYYPSLYAKLSDLIPDARRIS